MNHLNLGYSIQKYWRELLTFTFAIISAYVAFVYRDDPGVNFIFSILLTTVLLILTQHFVLKEKDSYYLALGKYADKDNSFKEYLKVTNYSEEVRVWIRYFY